MMSPPFLINTSCYVVCAHASVHVCVCIHIIGVRISGIQSSVSNQETLKSFLKPLTSSEASSMTERISNGSAHKHGSADDLHLESATPAEVPLGSTDDNLQDCPICGCQVSAENLILNQHIDECLNKPAIKEAIQDSATLPLFRGESRKRNQRGNTTNMDKKKSKLWKFTQKK